ncbi:MAG: type II secretion system protein GspM [Steroidobacteraceae bacterium]
MSADFTMQAQQHAAQLRAKFDDLPPRERAIVIGGVILVALVVIYTLGLAPLYKAVNDRSARIVQKQQDLVWMQSVAGQLSALNSTQPTASTQNESMVVLVANSASSRNVSSALTGQTPAGPNGVRVRFEGVSFDALIIWLGAIQKDYGIHVKDAEITRMPQVGQVSASLSLSRSGGR